MFGLGHWELLIILGIVLIIFGAGKLPEIGAGLGQGICSFKRGIADSEGKAPEQLNSGAGASSEPKIKLS
jgi:sec-independent protein translocase protein TatA